jgi:LssY-like putative type I secretion system component LssY
VADSIPGILAEYGRESHQSRFCYAFWMLGYGFTKIRCILPGIIIRAFFACAAVSAQNPQSNPSATTVAPTASTSTQIEASGNQQWVDTKLDLRRNETLKISATGTVTYADNRSFGPDGLTRGWKDLVHQYAVPDAGHGALIARLGADEASQPFLVGSSKQYVAPVGGRLFLGINQSQSDAEGAKGSFQVTIEILEAGSTQAAAALAGGPAETSIPAVTADILAKIPRRVSDPKGSPGDMVNVLIVGTEEQLTRTFAAAGWVQVDRSVQDTLLAGFLATMAKKDYLTMPMSTLYLFNRPQDFGFAHAEPVRVVMSRNHLRAWRSPYTIEDRPVWCIAATHDVGFERDQRNNGVTHKIDPAIDGEREYVNSTLSATGLVSERTHVTPPDPLTEANTATGGEFHSDGRILVLVLANTSSSAK